MNELVKAIPLPSWDEPKNINEAKIRILDLGRNMHEHAYLVGKDLIWVMKQKEIKDMANWVAINVWFSESTAWRFIAFAKKCDHQGHLLSYHPKKIEHSGVTVTLDGEYQTIVIDPPWPIQKIERYEAPYQETDLDYESPTMTVEAIKAIKLPIAQDCHLFLWTTEKFLPISSEIIEGWGFKYVLTMVWHKTGGFQPFGLPQYNCEFVVYGKIGSPKFIDTKDFFCCFDGQRREHSRKPAEFYDVIRRVCPPPRIDIFSREEKEGFKSFGDEQYKF